MKKRLIQFILFLLPACLLAGFVLGYDNTVIHPKLTRAAVDVYNREAPKKISGAQKEWIVQGSIDEDMHPRYLNHFYNPETGEGLYFLGEHNSAKDWAAKQSSATGNFDAQAIMIDYENGNYQRAFTGIGHILHLIEDMSVPAHTRLDAHEEGDPFEAWARQNNPNIDAGSIDILRFDNLSRAFYQLASYSHFNFFSKDTMFYVQDREVRSEKIEGKNGVYNVYCKDNNDVEFVCARKILTPNLVLYEIKGDEDFKIHQDYWRMLHPKAVGVAGGVIDLFMKEFEKIDEKKRAEKENKAEVLIKEVLYGSRMALRGAKSVFGYLVNETGDAVVEGKRLHDEFGAEGDRLALEIIKNSPRTIGEKSFSAIGDVKEGIESIKVLGESIAMTNKEEDANNDFSVILNEAQRSEESRDNQDNDEILRSAQNDIGIKYVIDGDTFVLDTGERIRLIGVDTPELNGAGKDDDECLAEWAQIRMKELLGAGKLNLVLDPGMDKDKYGRSLRYVYADNLFINEQLALEGRAKIFFGEPYFENCPVAEDMERKNIIIEAGKAAQGAKRGIYSSFCAKQEKVSDTKSQEGVFISYGGGAQKKEEQIVAPIINQSAATSTLQATSISSNSSATSTPYTASSTNPTQAASTPSAASSTEVAASTPATGTSTPGMASTTPQIGTSTPEVATTTIAAATGTQDQATSTPELPKEIDHLVISEVSAHGAQGKTDEFIEFYNPTDSIIHIKGYKLQNSAPESETWKTRIEFKHPRVVIYPHDYYLMASSLFREDVIPDFMKNGYFGLSDEGGNIRIIDDNGAVVDLLAYGSGEYGEGEAVISDFENMYSLERGGYDTNNNKDDFSIQVNPSPQSQLSNHFKYEWMLNEESGDTAKDNISGNDIILDNPLWNDNRIADYGEFMEKVYLDHSLGMNEGGHIEIPLDISTKYGFSLSFWYFTASSSTGQISFMLKNEEDDVRGGIDIYKNGFNMVAGDNNFSLEYGKHKTMFGEWNFCMIVYDREFKRISVYFPVQYKLEAKEGVFIKDLPDTQFSKLIINADNIDFSLNRLRIFDMPIISDEMYNIYFRDQGRYYLTN